MAEHYQTLQFELRDAVANVTFNRPNSFNAMNMRMSQELLDIGIRCDEDPAIRAVLFTGAGEQAFCAGGDLSEFKDDLDKLPTRLKAMTAYLHAAITRLARMDAPVVAAVNGVAAGAGMSFVSACDLVIAADSAKFQMAYTRAGLTPDGSGTYFLPRILGVRRTMELALLNRQLSAQEALEWGLVNRVVPAAECLSEATSIANQLASGPTRAYGGVKKLLQSSLNDSLEGQMEHETRVIAEAGRSEDGREGIKAFTEKRSPEFQGR